MAGEQLDLGFGIPAREPKQRRKPPTRTPNAGDKPAARSSAAADGSLSMFTDDGTAVIEPDDTPAAPDEQPLLFEFAPNVDIHLHSTLEAVATVSGPEPERTMFHLSKITSGLQVAKSRSATFPTRDLDRFLCIRRPAQVTLDAAALCVARAIWAQKLGWRPLKVERHGQRLVARSRRWPSDWRVVDAPWTAIATLDQLGIHYDVDPDAQALLTRRLADAGQNIATASLAGTAAIIEARHPDLLHRLRIPALAYVGGPNTGRYRVPLLSAQKLLDEPSVAVTDELAAAIRRANRPTKPLPHKDPFPWTLYPFQANDAADAIRILETTGGALLAGDMGSGKSQAASTNVYTPRGPQRVDELEVGDQVLGRDGRGHTVTGVYPQGRLPIWRVTLADRTYVDASGDHLWYVESAVQRKRGRPGKVLSTDQLREGGLRDAAGNAKWYIPIVEPLQFDGAEHRPVPAYLLGALLGDGGLTNGTPILTNVEADIRELLETELASSGELGAMQVNAGSDGKSWRLVAPSQWRNPLKQALEELGVWGKRAWEKSVPAAYLYAPVEERVAVLQGLLDTDGGVKNKVQRASIEFSSTSEQLVDDVAWLVRSLGGIARKSDKPRNTTYTHKGETRYGRDSWRVAITWNDALGSPFRCARKAAEYQPREKYKPTHAIVSIEPAGEDECVCISVDAPDQLFVTEHAILTHNTTVSLAIAHELECWPALVVCPLSAMSTWARQLTEMDKKYHLCSGSPDVDREMIEKGGWDAVVISYDRLHAFMTTIEEYRFASIIADELQRIRSAGSRRSRALRALAHSVPLRIGLSGTPIANRIDELLPIGAFLAPGEWRPRATERDLSDVYVGEPIDGAAAHLGTMMVRRRMEDTGVKLPPRTDHRVYVTLSPEQRRALEDLEREAEDDAESGEMTKLHAFVKLHRMRAIVSCPEAAGVPGPNPKLDSALSLIKDFSAQGRKGVIFVADRRAFTHLGELMDAAGITWVGIWGSTPIKERIAVEKRFHADDEVRVVLCTIQSAAESVTFSPTGTYLIFCSYIYNPSILAQAAARIYRANQTNPVDILYVHARGPEPTLDDRILEILTEKQTLIDRVVDGRQYTDPARTHYSMSDLMFMLTGKRDEKLIAREKDNEAAIEREKAAKLHARQTAHAHKRVNRESVDGFRDTGEAALTKEQWDRLEADDLDDDLDELLDQLADDPTPDDAHFEEI